MVFATLHQATGETVLKYTIIIRQTMKDFKKACKKLRKDGWRVTHETENNGVEIDTDCKHDLVFNLFEKNE